MMQLCCDSSFLFYFFASIECGIMSFSIVDCAFRCCVEKDEYRIYFPHITTSKAVVALIDIWTEMVSAIGIFLKHFLMHLDMVENKKINFVVSDLFLTVTIIPLVKIQIIFKYQWNYYSRWLVIIFIIKFW